MKITRYKRVQRYISFYKNNFDFHPPYQILIDGTFCNAALNNKVNIAEQMPKYLADEVKLLTTVCVVTECERLSKQLYGAMLIVKKFAVHKCGHERNPVSASECLLSLARNKDSHYMLATQDQDLTHQIRKLAHVPLIYLKMNTIVMEKPQNAAVDIAEKSQDESVSLNNHEFQTLKQLKQQQFGDKDDKDGTKKRKRKGPKGPNPLSCKKKKKTLPNSKASSSEASTWNSGEKVSKKRQRNRKNKIPNHIKRMMNKIENQLGS